MEYFVYIIKSDKKKWFYVGLTKNLNTRIIQHNLKKVRSTKGYCPFQLIFSQLTDSLTEARDL